MLPERVLKAKNILSKLNKRAFISGSFLYSKSYQDIDIFVLSKTRNQFEEGKKHFIFVTEKDFKKPMIASAMKYSISNFELPTVEVEQKRYGLNDTIMAYQISVSEYLDNDGFKTLKNIIMEYYLITKNEVLNSHSLFLEYENIINSKEAILKINNLTKELLFSAYSKRYLYDELVKFTKDFAKLIKKYSANESLIICKNFFDELKNECRNFETKT